MIILLFAWLCGTSAVDQRLGGLPQ